MDKSGHIALKNSLALHTSRFFNYQPNTNTEELIDTNNDAKEYHMSQTGTVKWFNPTKGFGFIVPDNGGSDVFVHISAVEQAGMQGLNEGQKLEFELQENRGKEAAANLKAVEG